MKKVSGLMQNHLLSQKLNQFDQLTQLISTYLSLPLENRLWPLINGRRLTLLTDDPQLATQARFMHKALCKHVSEHTELKISRLEVKLISIPLHKKRRKLNRQKLTTDTADVISSIAEGIEDEELKQTLQRLAQNSTQGKGTQTPAST